MKKFLSDSLESVVSWVVQRHPIVDEVPHLSVVNTRLD